MEKKISGMYTTTRGIRSTYEATWQREADGWMGWQAKVIQDGRVVGTPSGQAMMTDAEAAETVAALVCDLIEHQ